MAEDLPFAAALPLYVIAYSFAGICLVWLIEQIRRVFREW